jgi:predicted metal-dependent phosphoesterase TrpH
MRQSFAAVRARYAEEVLARRWYDVRTLRTAERRGMATPGYLRELLEEGHVTAVEMHSHTPRSDGMIEPSRIRAWTYARYQDGYFRHGHRAVPLVVVVTDHDYLYAADDLRAIPGGEGVTLLPAAEVSTDHGHVLYYGAHPEIVHALDLHRPRQSVELGGAEFLAMVWTLEGGVAVPAHPYRQASVLRSLPSDTVVPALLAVETLNGKTSAEDNRAALDYARRHGLRGVGGSDAHQVSHLYSYLTLFDGPIRSMADLVIALREGDYFPVHGEHLRLGGDRESS